MLCVFSILALCTITVARANAQTVPIYDIQYTVEASGESPYAGQEVTISGIVTAAFSDGYVIAEASGPWQAIFVYSIAHGPDMGDEVELTGTVSEYYGMTEIVNVTNYQHMSSGDSVDSTIVSVAEAGQEQYESVLITVDSVFVAGLFDYGEWTVSDGTDSLLCNDKNDYMYFPEPGDSLETVTGILFYSFGDFKLEPRATDDIKGDPIPHYALHGHIVTMNETRDIIYNAYLKIAGDEIVAIHTSRPYNIPVVETAGFIFPGLIDSHNHPPYNVLGIIPFQTLFTDRYEWQSHPLYGDFQTQLSSIVDYSGSSAQWLNVVKLAEVRALTAGTTSIQGLNCNGDSNNHFAHQGIIIDNIERFPARVYSKTFPLREGSAFWQTKSGQYWDRFVIHLSEGTSLAALDEFSDWQNLGMLDARTTIIHGVPYGASEWSAMAQAEANIIWSPTSNMRLYGQTADIPGALAAGVNVALSPDWTESGTENILDELKEAARINREAWGDVITPLQFAEFVTCNAARAAGIERIAGQISPGFRANLMVIPEGIQVNLMVFPEGMRPNLIVFPGGSNKPYDALLRAEPATVKLTVVDGRPMYGNPDLLAQFSFLDDVETITVGDQEKSLAIRINSHAIPDADKPFSEIFSVLEEAYQASEPKVCDFVGIQ